MSKLLIFREDKMQKKCDLFFPNTVKSERFKFIELFDKNFSYESEKSYFGYLHINVDRVKLVSVVLDLKHNGIPCFSVPVVYRDHKNIEVETAFGLAADFAKKNGASVTLSMRHQNMPPVFWTFDLISGDTDEEKSGGLVMIDRLDGHVWTYSEYEEYLYDYNNVL